MAHLKYHLFDKVNDKNPITSKGDNVASHVAGAHIHDLNKFNAADKAAAVKIEKDKNYRKGDHIRLLNEFNKPHTDTVSIDPAIKASKVDLNKVIINNNGFADRAAGVEFVMNPNIDGGYRLRIRLYDKIPKKDDLGYPTLVFYDWEFPFNGPGIDLNKFHFADKAAFIKVEKGPKYIKGDKVTLCDSMTPNSLRLVIDPEKNNGEFDLHKYNLTDKIAKVEFSVVPTGSHLVVGFHNRVEEDLPMFILNDVDPKNPEKLINSYNLNPVGIADKTAKIVFEPGLKYSRGDHIRLLDEVNKPHTDTVSLDPDIQKEVDLHKVIFNNKGFDDRTAGIEFVRNPNNNGKFRLRIRLYDMVPNSSFEWDLPSLIFYDWEFPNLQEIDLNNFHFADKAAAIWVEKGTDYVEGDRIVVFDNRGSSSDIQSFGEGKHSLNREGWADKIAAIMFDPVPPKLTDFPEKVELFEREVLKLVLKRSDPGSLNNRKSIDGLVYTGKATSAKIYGPAGSAVTFFDNQGYRFTENAVRIKKLIDQPINVDIAINFVTETEEAGDNIYSGKAADGKYEWKLFKKVKKTWIQKNIPFDLDIFFAAIKNTIGKMPTDWAKYVDAGVTIIQATGVGKKSISNNYRVDNCSSVAFDFEKI